MWKEEMKLQLHQRSLYYKAQLTSNALLIFGPCIVYAGYCIQNHVQGNWADNAFKQHLQR